MRLSNFERFLPWTGAIAGLAWIGQATVTTTHSRDVPGGASADVINENLTLNIISLAFIIVMGMSVLFFATAVRNLLRSAEANEGTYSSVAYGGWLLVAAGLAQMTVWGNGMLAAADDDNDGALKALDYVGYYGWAGMTIGLATAFIAMGLGGIRNAALPGWFAVVTIVLGVLCALGAAHIPPGGLVSYLLLPFWLIAAAIIIAKRQEASASVVRQT